MSYLALLLFFGLVLTNVVVSVYLERKVSAFIQDRLGPMEVGKWGLLQLIADLLKLVQKEDIVPDAADKPLFKFAPMLIFAGVFTGFAVMPLSPDIQASTTQTGIFLLLGIVSLDILGILMAGWASNNKYAILGAMRSVGQIVSYEIPLGLAVLSVVVTTQTLNLQEICFQQSIHTTEPNYLLGIKAIGIETTAIGGFLSWNIFRNPFLFISLIIFYIAGLAEANRTPFDLPEAESELVGGFHVEYAGFRWAIMFLSEYGMMLLISMLTAILFLGGWATPFPNIGSLKLADWTQGQPGTISGNLLGAFWLLLKSYLSILVMMWIRWTLPRLRIDQVMYLCWKVLTPFAIGVVLLSILWKGFGI